MIRRALARLMLIAALLGSAGCWSRIEVNDLAIVSAVAVDRTEEGRFRLFLQIVSPRNIGSGTEGAATAAGAAFITMDDEGRTIMDAARRIQAKLPRRIFWAHARVILVGERLAGAGMQPAIDFLTRHRELRLNNYLVLVRGDLERFMASPVNLEKLPAEYIRETLRSRIGTVVTVGDWAQLRAARGAEPVLGVVELVPTSGGAVPGQKPSLQLSGTALFRDSRLVGVMDDRTTAGLLWLRETVRRGTLTVTMKKPPGLVSLEGVTSRTTYQAALQNGQIVIAVHTRAEGDVTEELAGLDLSDPGTLELIQAEMGREMRRTMEAALEQMRTLNTDAVGFGEVVHRQLPAVWKRVGGGWRDQGFQKARILIAVDARVRRTGLSNKPRGYRDEELKKGGQ